MDEVFFDLIMEQEPTSPWLLTDEDNTDEQFAEYFALRQLATVRRPSNTIVGVL